jgi:HEAT repeat protein
MNSGDKPRAEGKKVFMFKRYIMELNDETVPSLERCRAAQQLGSSGYKTAVEPLVVALGDKDGAIRCAAANALGGIGDPRAIQPLVVALGDRDGVVRCAAAEALGRIGDPRAIQPLVESLKDSDERVCLAAGEALYSLGDKRAVEALIAALADKDSAVHCAAVKALGRLVAALKGDNAFARLSAQLTLNSEFYIHVIRATKAIEPLIEALRSRYKMGRKIAAQMLAKLGDRRAVEPLIESLNDRCVEVRSAAAKALGILDDKRAVEPLIEVLNKRDKKGWWVAIEPLSNIGDEKTVEPLIEVLCDIVGATLRYFHDTGKCRSCYYPFPDVIRAIGKIGDNRAVEPLIEALAVPDGLVQRKVIEVLGELGDERAVDVLNGILLTRRTGEQDNKARHFRRGDSEDWESVRGAAAEALGKIGSEKAIRPLLCALKDSMSKCHYHAAQALARLGAQLDSETAVEALTGDLLKSGDDWMRFAVSEALGKYRPKRAVELLIRTLKDKTNSARHVAAEALGKIGDVRAVEPLIDALKDKQWYVRRDAAEALGRLCAGRAVEPLIDVLKDKNWDVRRAATEALRRITKVDLGRGQERWRNWYKETKQA